MKTTGFTYNLRCINCHRSYASTVDQPGYCRRAKCIRAYRAAPAIVDARDEIRRLVAKQTKK